MSEVLAPCAGRVIPLVEVPDPVFAAEMVGPGVAIDPDRTVTTVCAPSAGTVVKIYPHAFVLTRADGIGLLVHLGINTVQLKGQGFEVHQEEGAEVEAGAPMVTWDPAAVEAGGRSPVIPICVMDAPAGAVTSPLAHAQAAAGQVLFTWPTE